jgi:hypothetical protein
MMTMSEIGEMHAQIVANGYVLEHVYEQGDYLRLLQSVEDVFGRMGDQEAFGTMVVVTRMLAGNVLERIGRALDRVSGLG